jgi:type IV pilus assembly protein PilQ
MPYSRLIPGYFIRGGPMKQANRTGALCLLTALILSFPVLPAFAEGPGAKTIPDVRTRIDMETRLFSIEVRDAEVPDVLRALAQQSGFNMIIGDGVAGKVSLSFKDIAFRDALEMIIKANGLMYTVRNNVFWVGKKVDVSDEMAMEVVRLNYADPEGAVSQVKGVLSQDGAAFADTRTGSVVIRDLPANIERAQRLLKAIDVQVAQVVIEARIVEASSNFSRQLGIQWGGTYTSGADTIGGSSSLPTPSGERNFAVNLPASSPTSGLGIVLGSLSSSLTIDLELSAAESNGELKIVSRPRIATLNNKAATIHAGLTFRVKLTSTTSSDATSTTTSTSGLEEIKTGIDLTVTPQISADGYILMNISTSKSDPDYSHTVDGIPGVSEKSASTYVLVKDGDTVVIGGLYRMISSEQDGSVPILSSIPLLGYLFKSTSSGLENEELLVFITPTVVRHENKEVLH